MSSQDNRAAEAKVRHGAMVGDSPAFKDAQALLDKLSACDATVLIRGETGTGKELAARAIHYGGVRAGRPFIPINCGAIAPGLVESELFGAERGAFTDARESRAGLVAQAAGGTLLLDEVDMLDARAQVVLLRFLEDREYRPVGGNTAHADVRVIAASNRCLKQLAEQGQFRQDLLFRLDLVRVHLPALRDRGDDVLRLAEAFIDRYAREYRKPSRRLHPDTVDAFLNYQWPGNVRELQNLIHRQFLISDTTQIMVTHPGSDSGTATKERDTTAVVHGDFKAAKARAIANFEKSYLAELLERTDGNISRAARIAGKERSALGKLMKKHGLARKQFLRA